VEVFERTGSSFLDRTLAPLFAVLTCPAHRGRTPAVEYWALPARASCRRVYAKVNPHFPSAMGRVL